MLTKEQIKQVKDQLLKQIESWPESQRENAKEQINSLNDEELVEFLVKNKLVDISESSDKESIKAQSPFRLIINGKIPSFKIGENKEAVAVLEINPVSKAHTIIIPKKALKSDNIPKEILELANEVSEKIKEIFNPKKVEITSTEILEERIIQLLPIYDNETLNSNREKANEKDLKEIEEKINNYTKKENIKEDKPAKKEIPLKKLPKAPVRRP